MITITKNADGFAVSFPKILLPAFKPSFPSARWQPYSKVWQLGPRSGKRLEEWKAEIEKSGAAEKLQEAQDAAEEAGFSQADLATIKTALNEMEGEIRSMSREIARKKELVEQLKEKKAELDEISTELQAVESVVEDAKATLDEIVQEKCGVSLNQIAQVRSRALRHWKTVGMAARSEFEDAQGEAQEIIDELDKIGVSCRVLNAIVNGNFNRYDRDGVAAQGPIRYKLKSE